MKTKFKYQAVRMIFKESLDCAKDYGLKAEFILSYKQARRTKELLVTPRGFVYLKTAIHQACYIALDEWDI